MKKIARYRLFLSKIALLTLVSTTGLFFFGMHKLVHNDYVFTPGHQRCLHWYSHLMLKTYYLVVQIILCDAGMCILAGK